MAASMFMEKVSAQGTPLLIYQASLMNSAVTFSSLFQHRGHLRYNQRLTQNPFKYFNMKFFTK